MNFIINVVTNQFFLLFITVASGLALGKIKIKNFSLGVSGGIFTGIVIGWAVMHFANNASEGGTGFGSAMRIQNSGIISSAFFTLFLLLFLCAIGLTVGKNIGKIFRKYGIKFVVIGMVIPLVSMLVTFTCLKIAPSIVGEDDFNGYEISGLYSGAMTSTPAYGTALDVVGGISNVEDKYAALGDAEKTRLLNMIDPSGSLTPENTPTLSAEQADTFRSAAQSSVSLGYTVAFPVGVIVIILCISFFPLIFRINIKKEAEEYQADLVQDAKAGKGKDIPEGPFNVILFSIVMCVGIFVGNITIPLGAMGEFSLGAAGGVLISALVFSYIGKIGKLNFRMETKMLVFLRELGLTFFMAVVGLTYGYDVVNSFAGSGIMLAVMAIAVEGLAVLVSFLIGRFAFKLNWTILSGAICGGCTSAPGLGAAIDTVGNDEPTTGYGAAQPFAILANVLLISIFHTVFFI